uniref:Fibrous sheath-interacting protein 1 n=1 Tax=Crassostrea virginica TaxID=6565 RepID=A0A8B8DMP9_CRAVI|nr:fibrous sheath-interacting protein 1-like [Crassostrea virginica]
MDPRKINRTGVPLDQNNLGSLDLHLNLEDLADMSNSDSSDDDENQFSEEEWPSANEEEEELMRLTHDLQATNEKKPQLKPQPPPPKQSQKMGALLPYDDGIDVDSEEENEIMKEIKAEISKQMREEMKSELEVYKEGMEALEQGTLPGARGRDPSKEEEGLEDMEPKLREAILKMRKLDRILTKKVKREKEVKRDRLILERRIKEEIAAMKTDGKGENREEKNNTEKYLALTLPPRHNEGVSLSETTGPDVFTTELNEADYPGLRKDQQQKDKTQRSDGATSQNHSDTHSEHGSEMSTESKKRKHRRKNFIKRNKELAKDAGSEVAMTDEEKIRVEGLLKDLDELPELLEDEDGAESCYQIAVRPGEGFCPDPDEMRVLDGIDSRLKELLPPEEFEEVTARRPQTHHNKLFTPVGFKNSSFEHFGERALMENKEQREIKSRLQRIEDELSKLHNPEEIEIETPDTLSEDQLNDLLDQCARSLSRSTIMGTDSRVSHRDAESRDTQRSVNSSRASMPESDADSMYLPSEDTTPRSHRSARELLMENPPKLSEEELQKLLAEAHFPLKSRLSTLMEEEEEVDTDIESRPTSITAETWKLISQEKTEIIDQNESERSVQSSVVFTSVTDTERSSSRNSQIPVLPEINRSGSLISQWNNERPPSSNSRNSSVLTIKNSFNAGNVSDSIEIMSIGSESVASTPRPPSGEKPNNLSHRSKMDKNILQST